MKVGTHKQYNVVNIGLALQFCIYTTTKFNSLRQFICKSPKYDYNWLILQAVVMKVGIHIKFNVVNIVLALQVCKQQQIPSGSVFVNYLQQAYNKSSGNRNWYTYNIVQYCRHSTCSTCL